RRRPTRRCEPAGAALTSKAKYRSTRGETRINTGRPARVSMRSHCTAMARQERPEVKPSASCRPPDDGGFTLIEIVIALAVVGLIVGLVIPIATGWLSRLGQSSQL